MEEIIYDKQEDILKEEEDVFNITLKIKKLFSKLFEKLKVHRNVYKTLYIMSIYIYIYIYQISPLTL